MCLDVTFLLNDQCFCTNLFSFNLGGILAALGDRLGSKVGKARLTLFNLRPKQTAVVVTVMTGTVIAASTLGLLFGLSKSLRQGFFSWMKSSPSGGKS